MAKAVVKKAGAATPVRRASAGKRSVAKSAPVKKAAASRVPAKRKVAPSVASSAAATAVDAQVLAHGLHGLLHTMQTVQQFEETLCSLMHALRRGRPTGALLRELKHVLEQLPAQDYKHEVDALRDAVAA